MASDDLTARLRDSAPTNEDLCMSPELHREAADRIEAQAERIAELEDDAKYLGQRTIQMHRQAMQRARDAEAERDAALADVAKLREAAIAVHGWLNHAVGKSSICNLCDALADTEEAP